MDEHTISPAGDPFHAAAKHRPDEDLETHYAALERACSCLGGWHYLGYMVEGEDGDEVETYEVIPCKRCQS